MVTDRLTGLKINERYEILSRLATGGMADVYLGFDTQQKRKVAIKVLHENYSSNKNFIARFRSEAKILTRLSNPNIVSIYEWGEFNDLYFIIMEYVSGESLKKVIEKNGTINPRQAARYAIQICNALQEAHANNLIHRDIKPQNIMISDDSQVKLTDFGIAKTVADDITKTMGIFGTAHYVSPEQAQGKILDFRSDIYSLGIVMYEMLTGDVPFRGGSSIDISLRHISDTPQPFSNIMRDVPLKIEKIVMKCIQKNPAFRYEGASELKKDLENFLEGRKLLIESGQPAGIIKTKPKKRSIFGKNTNRTDLDKLPAEFQIEGVYPGTASQLEKAYGKYYSRTIRFRNFLISIIVIVSILFFIFLSLFLLHDSRLKLLVIESSYVSVPPIVNIRAEEAKNILSTIGLDLKIIDSIYSDTVEKDFIISQEPAENEELAKGSIINIVVSKGKEVIDIIVPNMIGLKKDQALEQIEESGLTTGNIIEEFNDYFDSGQIIDHSPAGGKTVNEYSPIDLVISKGEEFITIPELAGLDYILANSSLETLGLIVFVEKDTSSLYPPGIVIGTMPVAGSVLKKNDIVTLILATSEEMQTVPELISMEFAQAQQLLESMEIGYEVSFIKVDYSIQKNSVIAQYPDAGGKIVAGEKIIIFVGN